jgi:hypothetical protein
VLIAIEDEYRAYREVIAAGLEALRPGTEVAAVGLDRLDAELARLDPEVVVCSRPGSLAEAEGRPAWVELSLDTSRPTKVSVGGRRSESVNPTLETLLAVIDEAEGLPRTPSARSPENGPFEHSGG